ncbi:MAG: phage terminase large subunit family protein [Verrucomicrobia subdivision 3 bacterium]|nr:phage terminase large subunit family protein [Limisphaerales bacterium]
MALLKPPPKIDVAAWAEAHRYLAIGTSAEAGKFHVDRLPYQREPMEMLTDREAGEVVLQWGAQLGKTEILLNALGYFIQAEPASILCVYPTLDTARKFSQKKLGPMIAETPVLKDKVRDPRQRDSGNTILSKDFPGGSIIVAGSNSPSSLRSLSCRVVIQDEIDTYEVSAGAEGDPSVLADARAMNFHNAVLIKASTPTIRGASRIEAKLDESDNRRWAVDCAECGKSQVLAWSQVKWPKDDPAGAFYECTHCQSHWSDQDRVRAILAGKWVAEHPERRVRGYHLSGLYRIMGRKRQFESYLHEFAQNFLDAKHAGRESLKVWTNTFLAETWEEAGDRIELESLTERGEDYTVSPVPESIGVLTCGVDVQGDRLELEVVGWGTAEESWGIEYRVLFGDPEQPDVWKALDDYLSQRWDHPSGARLGIACCCVDSGFSTRNVYQFTRPRQSRRIYAVKGSNQSGAPLIAKRSGKAGGRVLMFNIGTDTAKDSIFARLKIEDHGPRFMHFPNGQGYTESYFKQLTAEEVRTRMHHGFPIRYYKKIRDRNEALDLRVYNLAALEILSPNMDRILNGMKPDEPVKEEGNPLKTYKLRPSSNFATGWQ